MRPFFVFIMMTCVYSTLNAQRIHPKYLTDLLHTADPSVHLFNGKIFIYPSHDIETDIKDGKDGAHYNMRDYHVFSMDEIGGKVTNHGVVLRLEDISWAKQQLWAPDAAFKAGMYYFYFPAKDKEGIFRIGVASSNKPEGPFLPEKSWIEGSYSIDPAVYKDNENDYYMFFGGISGGQLQLYRDNKYGEGNVEPTGEQMSLMPKVAKLTDNMLSFEEAPKDVMILDEKGEPLKANDKDRRFFEGVWVHRFNNMYYLSYSTGSTHKICYAISESIEGPYVYQGVLMTPVKGWTTHHSIIEINGKWYIFYHDAKRSNVSYLRDVKYRELVHHADGRIVLMEGLD